VSGGPYVTVACPTSTTYTDAQLTNGTTYYYVVSAVYTGGPDAGGASVDSGEATATPQASAPPQTALPLPPTGLTATPGNAQVALNWIASSGATSYNVKRATVTGGPYTIIASFISTTSYTDTGLTNGTTYYYVVTAVNSAGESGNSPEVKATPQATTPPAPPIGLTAKSTSRRTITLNWTQSTTSGVTQNRIYRRRISGSYSLTPTATVSARTSYLDTGLSSGKTYCYVVTAVSSGGESAGSNEACTTSK
jgi:fibronectin type 3 domain-containing protein